MQVVVLKDDVDSYQVNAGFQQQVSITEPCEHWFSPSLLPCVHVDQVVVS